MARGLCAARYATASARLAGSAEPASSPPERSIVTSTMSSATWIDCARSSSAAACVSARTPKAPAAQSPRPLIARRDDPPVTWTTVAGPPWSVRKRADALRNANAPRTGMADQSSKPEGAASASGPPPNGPERLPPYGDAAFTTRSRRPWRSATPCSAPATEPWSVTSTSSASAPAARTRARVSADRAPPATAHPSARRRSMTAKPRLRAPRTRAVGMRATSQSGARPGNRGVRERHRAAPREGPRARGERPSAERDRHALEAVEGVLQARLHPRVDVHVPRLRAVVLDEGAQHGRAVALAQRHGVRRRML